HETEGVCRALGLEFVEDPTNAADGPWRAADGSPLRRAAVRERVLPALTQALGPGVPEALARTADQLRADADLLDALAADLLARAQTGGSMAVTREVAAAAPSATSPAPDAAAPVARATAVVLDVDVLAAAHPALRGRALRLAALAAGAPGGALGS